jgi:hypothetical protein
MEKRRRLKEVLAKDEVSGGGETGDGDDVRYRASRSLKVLSVIHSFSYKYIYRNVPCTGELLGDKDPALFSLKENLRLFIGVP